MSTTSTARIRTSRFVDVIGMIAVVTSLVLGLVPGVASASHGTGNLSGTDFELDGNVAGSHDWEVLGGELAPDGTEKGGDENSWFKASTKEQDYPNWQFVTKGNADKSDLDRLFVASQVAGADSYLWLGASRVSDNGNTQVSVEFNQQETTNLTGQYRTAGDIYIRFNFPGKQSSDSVTVGVSQWPSGQTSGAYPAPTTLPAGAFKYALGGLGSGASTDFIELQLSLEAIFGEGGLGLECAQFGGANFRTESSGGSDNNNDPTLKDVAGPYPIDLDTCADVDVKKVDAEGNPLSGASFAAFQGHGAAADGTAAADCTTDATGTCSLGEMLPGLYTLHEVKWDTDSGTWVSGAPDGYDISPQLIGGYDFEVESNTSLWLPLAADSQLPEEHDPAFIDPRIDYVIDVTPDTDTNSATNAHEFTVTLAEDVNGNGEYDEGTDTPLDGESVSLAWEDVSGVTFTGAITKVGTTVLDPALTSTSCTTDASGQCLVTVSSDSAGGGTLSATWTGMDYQHTTTADPVTNATMGEPYDSITDSGSKSWIGYRVTLGDDGLNLIRDDHDFTVTVFEVDQAGNESLASSDTTVKVKWQGPTGSTLNDVVQTTDSCVTAGGTCIVTVGSSNPGSGTLHVTEVSGQPVTGEDLTVTFADDEVAADKTWVEFRALISGDSTNLVDEAHTFDVNAEYRVATGDTWQQVPDGSDVAISTSTLAPGQSSSDTCDDTTAEPGTYLDDRVCTVTVDADAAGSVTVTIDGINSAVITHDGITEDFAVDFGANESGVGTFTSDDYSSTKSWGSYSLALTPGQATNLLTPDGGGQDHTITATLSSEGSAPVDGQEIDIWVSGGDAGAITSVENGSLGEDGVTWTCTTDADGECDIVVTSSAPGTIKIDADFRSDHFDSGEIHVEADEATKDWTEFQVTVSPDAENLLSTNGTHTFTVYVEQFNPDQPVEDAVLSIGVEQEDETKEAPTVDDSDCTDGNNPGGLCEVHVTTTEVQRVTLTATYGAVVASAHLEDDQTADFKDEGTKTWIDYRVDVTPETDTNLVNTDHTFTVTITRITPDGEEPVDDGTVPTVAYGGGAQDIDLEAGTCDNGTVSGTCTVVVSTAGTGTQTLIVTYEGTASGEVGVEDDHSDTFRGTAAKTWVDYRVTLDDDAVNTVGDEHTFTALLEVDNGDGEGWVPAVGETLQFTLDGVGSVTGGDVDATLACITNDDDPGTTDVDEAGTCTIAINSGEAGTSTVGVSYTVPQGTLGVTAEAGVSRADTAVKQWVDIELVKTAVTGDGFSDGDLIADPGGFPFLAFTSSDQGPKTAVFEYLITNPSNVTLEDVALVDDRLGTIELSSDCQTLDPGESCTARGSEQFDYDDATAALGSLITNVGTVTATGGGEEVSDSDDATITLVAVQSSILIDLVKDVVAGEGDVEEVDGLPIVNWSEEEYEDEVTKTVRYRFTVTNISNAPIIDVELIDPMISDEPIIAVSDGVTLQPGESTVVEVDHQLTVGEAFPDGPIASKVDNVATVSGANETRDSFSESTDDASVFSEIVFAEVLEKEEPLPVTGFGAGGLVPVSMLLIMVGAAVLWLDRRRVTGR